MSKFSEFEDKSKSELWELRLELRKEQLKLRMQNRTSGVPHHDRFGKVRRDIARIETVLSAKRKF